MRSQLLPFVVICLIASLPHLVLADHHKSLSENDRAKAFMKLKFAYSPAVFGGDKFPQGDFLRPKRAEELIGAYNETTAYYDAGHQLVEKPEEAGRYGAIATIKAAKSV